MDKQSLVPRPVQEAEKTDMPSLSCAIDSVLSMEENDKVTTILDQVSQLTDLEKYLLYLRLPTDGTDESTKHPPTSMAKRTNDATTWIRSNYIENRDACVQKQDVYDHYRADTEASGNNPLSSGDFGKVVKLVFPNIHQRRLGQRGKSKYFYWGLKRKEDIDSSSSTEMLPQTLVKEDTDLYDLSCQLVCEWATQLLERPFTDIRNLSEYLVSIGLSCGKTAAKFSLLSGSTSPPRFLDKDRKSPSTKHQDRQMILQRKLQGKEIVREHKQRLKQQQKCMRELQSSKSTATKSAFSPTACTTKGTEKDASLFPVVPGRNIQPRPLSVQPYMQDSHSGQACVSNKSEVRGTDADGSTYSILRPVLRGNPLKVKTTEGLVRGSSGDHEVIDKSTHVAESTSGQPKRCHSTSVVEKFSTSMMYGMEDVPGKMLDNYSSSGVMTSSCEMNAESSSDLAADNDHTTTSSDAPVMISSMEDVANGFFPKASCALKYGASRNITRMLESPTPRTFKDGLLIPQHPKRNGDAISPDRCQVTKRRCMTSLGVSKQHSLEVEMMGRDSFEKEITRLRPFSCPISVDDSAKCVNMKRGKSFLDPIDTKSCDGLMKDKVDTFESKLMGESRISAVSEKKREDRKKVKPGPHSKKNNGQCHFVQKPTVINRPVNVLPSASSCSDIIQSVSNAEMCSQEIKKLKPVKSSYNILNSLLANCDRPPEPVKTPETSPVQHLSLSPNTQNLVESANTESNQFRLMANPPHPVENAGILSSLSSRSAFVPVTSHKHQPANSVSKDKDNVISAPSTLKQSTVLNKSRDNENLSPSSASHVLTLESQDNIEVLCKSRREMATAAHSLEKKSSDALTKRCGLSTFRGSSAACLKLRKESIYISSASSSSSSSSSSSTLVKSGDSTSSGGESAFTTPVPISGVEKAEACQKAVLSIPAKQHQQQPTTTASYITSTSSTVALCKSSPTVGCSTPVLSPHAGQSSHNTQTVTVSSNSTTPPKRSNRNRFTPIRPKLGGGAGTPSPQKLGGGSTTPSPQKKDMRPVAAILKEQRVSRAQDLLLNLANSYPGEVKLQMPAELLGLSPPGKSKSSDVLVTIGPPNNNTNISQHSNFQPNRLNPSPQLFPVSAGTPLHKEITVIVEPVSQAVSQSAACPVVSSCVISAAPTHILQTVPQTGSVQNLLFPQPLFSPNGSQSSQNSQQTLLASTTMASSSQVIVLSPSTVSNLSTNVGSSPSMSIIVQDEKGNKYSLEKRPESTPIPQNLHKFIISNQRMDAVTTPSPKTVLSNASSLLNVSEIKGHVVGPDAHGQTYLLVPNSESVISTSSTPSFSFLPQQSSPVLNLSLTSSSTTRTHDNVDAVVSGASTAGVFQPHASSSSALLSELSQLASAGQNMCGPAVIQHNSGSSAFHKCSSGTNKKANSATETDTHSSQEDECVSQRGEQPIRMASHEQIEKERSKDADLVTSSEARLEGSAVQHIQENAAKDSTNKDTGGSASEEAYVLKSQGMRKRKASKSRDDEHEDKKRLNFSKEPKEVEDDVFIVKYEEDINANPGKESLAKEDSSKKTKTDKENFEGDVTNDEAVDRDIYKRMCENTKLTVKEFLKCMNELKAKQNKESHELLAERSSDASSLSAEKSVLSSPSSRIETDPSVGLQCGSEPIAQLPGSKRRPKSVNKTDRVLQSTRCSSVSPYPTKDSSRHALSDESCNEFDKTTPKVHRDGRRHISLNLESVESDALLDSESSIDHRLVGDIKDVKSIRSGQKTSVGVAAKSAKSTTPRSSSVQGSERKAKQSNQTHTISASAIRSFHRLLHEKKQSSASQPSGDVITPHHSAESHRDFQKEQNMLSGSTVNEGTDTKFPSKQRRSMSCVRDILQRGEALGKDFSTVVGKITSEDGKSHPFLSKSSIHTSTGKGSKASNHPFLAHRLSTTTVSVNTSTDLNLKPAQLTVASNKGPSGEGASHSQRQTDMLSSSSENELPGDILDFITESMSTRNPSHSILFGDNSVSSLLADLVQNGPADREQAHSDGQNPTVWRSMSVPNTIADSPCQFWNDAGQKNTWKSSEITQSNAPSFVRSKSVVTCGNDQGFEQHSQQSSINTALPSPEIHSLRVRTESHGQVSFDQPLEIVNHREASSQHASPTLETGTSSNSGTFLSPTGPAKLTRRSSVERSGSGDRSTTKTPVEFLGAKAVTERPPSRIKTPVDRYQTKTPVDRLLAKTPIDRTGTKLAADRSSRKTSRNSSPSTVEVHQIKDHTTAAVLQQSMRDKDPCKVSVNRTLTKSPIERALSTFIHDRLMGQGSVNKLTQQDSVDSLKGDRSLSQTPVSDAGYSSVSPSPIMMSTAGLSMFGECGRRDPTSPGTIFMPMRSDSALSMTNCGRNNDGFENGVSVRTNSSATGTQGAYTNVSCTNPAVDMAFEEDEQNNQKQIPSTFGQDVESAFLQNAIDETLFVATMNKGHAKCDILRSSDQDVSKQHILDLEKLMSASLNCIPTPPCSPSSSPQHPSEAIQSPLSFSAPLSNIFHQPHSQQNHQMQSPSIPAHVMPSFSTVTMTSSMASSCTSNMTSSLSCMTHSSPHKSSPCQSSPTVTLPLNISPLPCGSSFLSSSPQYNPHPSPPFTPSSQRCLASPRCPTPCSHRSLMSPRCATPCGDSNSAPNRFMPIQTSGILTVSSASTYIQPIRPTVTLASLANQKNQNNLVFSKPGYQFARVPVNKANQKDTEHTSDIKNFSDQDQASNLNSFFNSSTAGVNSYDTNAEFQQNTLRKDVEENTSYTQGRVKTQNRSSEISASEGSAQPALVLSLTGSIGSVSGQGMKAGWSRDIAGHTSSLRTSQEESETLSFQSLHRLNWGKDRSHDFTTNNTSTIEREMQISSATYEEAVSLMTDQNPRDYFENPEQPVDCVETHRDSGGDSLLQGLCQTVNEGTVHLGKTHQTAHQSQRRDITSRSNKPSMQPKPGTGSLVDTSQNVADFPFSHQLTMLSGRSRSESTEQQQEYAEVYKSETSGELDTQLGSLIQDIASPADRKSSLTAMMQTPAFAPSQFRKSVNFSTGHSPSAPFKPISDLPTAYYAGTAPNIDVTKTSILPSSYNDNADQLATPTENKRPPASVGANLTCFESLPNQDVLGDTLDFLKDIDSQYFQPDDDSNSCDRDKIS